MIKKIQIGTSVSADFQENSWTFEMPSGFEMSAGPFAIVPLKNRNDPSNGILNIVEERLEQIHKHGRTIERDVEENPDGQLVIGAIALIKHKDKCLVDEFPDEWSKDICKKMAKKPYNERLEIAGALLAGEIDRVALEKFFQSRKDEGDNNEDTLS